MSSFGGRVICEECRSHLSFPSSLPPPCVTSIKYPHSVGNKSKLKNENKSNFMANLSYCMVRFSFHRISL